MTIGSRSGAERHRINEVVCSKPELAPAFDIEVITRAELPSSADELPSSADYARREIGGLGPQSHGAPGATGVAQWVELFAQLRGEAVIQVDAARIASAHSIDGPTAVPAVTILQGQGTDGD